ncbi:MAG: permease [Gemmatimonadetes bacterium]|nr:permease [Gemmatimonadota bacterium]
MELLLQDTRFALRSLRKHRSTTIVAMLCLALGIGANTAIYSVVRAVLLDSLPYREPERLLKITETYVARGERGTNGSVSPDNFRDWKAQTTAFVDMAAYRDGSLDLGDVADPERLRGMRVTANLFTVLGARPVAGRAFLPQDDEPAAAPTVVVGEGLWRRRFSADPKLIGTQITLGGAKYTVIGVMPGSFDFPVTPVRNDFWRLVTTASMDQMKGRAYHALNVVGRLAPTADSVSAAADLARITSRIAQEFPESQKNRGALAVSLAGNIVGNVRPALLVLLGAVGLVLLIACANVANLLLARAAGRRREIAIRTALGAERTRLVRQLLTESLVLAVSGGVLGLAVAQWGLRALVGLAASSLPRSEAVGLNGRVMLFAMIVSLATGFIFGIVPALRASRTDLREDLSESAGRTSASRRQNRTLDALIVGEIAISLVLLVGAGLVIRGFVSLLHIEPGFKPDGVLAFHASAQPTTPDSARYGQFYAPVLQRLRALPGVRDAAFTSLLPIQDAMTDRYFTIIGRPVPEINQHPDAEQRVVSSNYFHTLGIPMVAGREFTDGDGASAPPVIIINDELAKSYFPGESPLGKQIDASTGVAATIVGVAKSVRQMSLDQEPRAEFYLPAPQALHYLGVMAFVISTQGSPESFISSVRNAVHAVAPQQPVYQIATMNAVIGNSLATRKLVLVLLTIFAGLALALSAAGVYGVMSYGVSQRTREIGIRMALGARAGDVTAMVLRDAAKLVGAGVGIGLVGAALLSRMLQSLLYDVGTHDPLTFALVPALIVATALVASALPALRAARVDPLDATRAE